MRISITIHYNELYPCFLALPDQVREKPTAKRAKIRMATIVVKGYYQEMIFKMLHKPTGSHLLVYKD